MTWLVLTIILGLIGTGGLVYAWATPMSKLVGLMVTGACGAVWVVMTFFLSIHTVGAREIGIQQSFSGAISGNTKSTGVVFIAPWNHLLKENIGLSKEVFTFNDSNGLGSAVSRDQQSITATVAVNYQVEPANVIRLYRTVGPQWRNILLDGRVPQAFKETTAQFPSAELTLKRPQLRLITLQRLRSELTPYDIRVVDVFISNIGYSADYEKAIELKLRQQQAAQTAEAKVAQIQAEAQQRVAAAEGEAKSIELEGRALRNNPEVLRLRAINALNPKAQIIFCSTGDCPSILGGQFTTTPGK